MTHLHHMRCIKNGLALVLAVKLDLFQKQQLQPNQVFTNQLFEVLAHWQITNQNLLGMHFLEIYSPLKELYGFCYILTEAYITLSG